MQFNISNQDKDKIGVYCITNSKNGKIYIGSTGNSFYNRFHQHLSDYKNGKHNGVILKRAFDAHGIENFIFSIICICDERDRLTMEQFYIDKGVDYNCAMIAGSLLGLKHSNTSKTRTIIGGLHHTSKDVYQFDLDGKFIKKHTSIIEALKKINKTKNGSSHITQVCIGKTFSAFGYRWSFSEILIDRKKRVGMRISIEKGCTYKEFDSQVEAANYIKTLGFKANQGRITRAIFKKERVYGFIINKI